MTIPTGATPPYYGGQPSVNNGQPSFNNGQPSFNNQPEQHSQLSQPAFNSQPAQPGFAEQAYPRQPYNAPQAYAPQPYFQPQGDPKATTVMVLGILGIFFGLFALIGWIIGASAQKQAIAEGRPIDPKLKTWTTVSKVFTIIYIAMGILWIILLVVGMAMFY